MRVPSLLVGALNAMLLLTIRSAFAACPPEVAEQVEIANEINLARSAPREYAARLQSYFASMRSDGVYSNGGKLIRSKEGRVAVDEAVAFLLATPSMPPLRLVACLSASANDHIAERESAGGLGGHIGADGSRSSDRAARRVGAQVYCGENISYGRESAQGHVIALLVDDGVASRGHRSNIFRKDYKTIGVGYGPHSKFGNVTVHVMCIDDLVN